MANRHDPKTAEALFEKVLERDAKRLLTMARGILRDHQAAEEALQDAFLRLWDEMKAGKVGEDCGGWLWVVTANLAKSRLRQLSNSEEETLDNAYLLTCEDPTPEEKEDRKKFNAIVNALPPQQRLAFQLTFITGMSSQEAAVILGCSEESVRKYARMAKVRIRAFVPRDIKRNLFSLGRKDLQDTDEKPPDSISRFDGQNAL